MGTRAIGMQYVHTQNCPGTKVNNEKWKMRIYVLCIIFHSYENWGHRMSEKNQRALDAPFFIDEVVQERLQVFPRTSKNIFKSRVICYLIRHWLKFKKEILKVLFILISYTFSVRLFLGLLAQNLKCFPESLCTAVTLHTCQ